MDKHSILRAAQPKTEVVEIPEWGHDGEPLRLTIRQLTASQITAMMAQINGNGRSTSAYQIAGSVINDAGELVFTSDDIPAIEALSASGIARLNIAINKLNGFLSDPEKN